MASLFDTSDVASDRLPSIDREPSATRHPSSRARLYRLLWRWHFYAGLITAPVFLVAAITGGIYVFIEELQPRMYPELFCSSSTSGSHKSLDELAAAVKKAHPEAQLNSAAEAKHPGLNAVFAVKLPIGPRTVFVDPATGDVAGSYYEPDSFFGIVLGLHRRLLLGSVGRMVVELAASWGLVLLITGIYLWWPQRLGRPRLPTQGVWYPRVRGSWLLILRDWHSVVGFYALGTAAFILFTGLFFTQVFGNGYKRATNLGGELPAAFAFSPKSEAPAGRSRVSLAAVLDAAEPHLPGHGARRIQFPSGPQDVFRVFRASGSSPTWRTTVFVDAYTARVVHSNGWDDAPLAHKVRMSAYPIHVGSIFGMTTKVLALLTCAALVLLAITGVWMWWHKRPQGTWGFPPSNTELAVPGRLIAVICGLGIFLPAVGGSLLLILLGESIASWWGGRRAINR
ncbi:MAG: hypothetical protein C0483_17235 [Pirellula sp.]|nr:hypothetical protein [Pirellula sp.]